jgi:magnesium-transporting ATPase (P-type)
LRGVFVNAWLWGAIALSAVLQVAVVSLEPLNAAFVTEPLDLGQWLVCIAMASGVLWVGELRKLVVALAGARTR